MSAAGKLILRNYRCFGWDNPATLEFGNGFTALIGPNNAGKSTALRAIFELRQIFGQVFTVFVPPFGVMVNPDGISDTTEIANEESPDAFEFTIEISEYAVPQMSDQDLAIGITFRYDVNNRQLVATKVETVDSLGKKKVVDRTYFLKVQATGNGTVIRYIDGKSIEYGSIYEFALTLHRSRFFPAFRNAINEGAGTYYDLPVGTALVNTWDEWKAGDTRIRKIAISRVEREIADLLGFESLQINADKSGKTFDVIVNGRPKKLYEVGAGVAQLIIVLAAALVMRPPYILIDEPELSLHPALQINFLATLASYATKGVLYATHSIGLARSTAERIYVVSKVRETSSSMRILGEKESNFGELLGELSYSSRIELGCDGILLVEGPTEILCFQEFLRKVGKDQKYISLSLGGSSLIRAGVTQHLAELTRILEPSKIRCFIDSERGAANDVLATDRAAFVSECASIGISVVVSERRATENYFEGKGIQRALGGAHLALGHHQKLKEAANPWHKSENWKIARETQFDDIKNTDLGLFLSSL